MANIPINQTSSYNPIRAGLSLNIRWNYLLPGALFLLALLPRILNLDTFITADEDDQIMFAHLFLKSILQGDFGGALVLGYPGVPTLILGGLGVGLRYLFHYTGLLPLSWVTAGLMDTLTQTTTQFGVFDYPLDFLVWVRAPMAVTAALSVLGIYLLTRHLLDERLALLGTLIIAFDPFILAHSRVIHVDAPLSYFMFLSFLAFLLYLKNGRWKWLILSGLFGGLAGLSKTPAGLLGPILVVGGLLYVLFPPDGLTRSLYAKRFVVAILGWGVIAAGAFFAMWPSMWSRPLYAVSWIIGNIRSVSSSAHPTTGVFWGNAQSDQNPFYYLLVLPYHLTPLTTIGIIIGLGLIVAGLVSRWRKAENNWAGCNLALALSLIGYIAIFIAPVSAISRRGDRYILPVFFATGLLTAMALWWLASLFRPIIIKKRFRLTPTKIVGVAVLVQALFVLMYHPYYLAYYNPVMSAGYRTAPQKLNIGWGEGLDLAAGYLNKVAKPDKNLVASWYSGQFAPYYNGKTIDLSNQTSALTGDYTVFYINQVQRGFPSGEILSYFQQREPLKVIKVGGIEYAWIYEGPVISDKAVPDKNLTFPTDVLMGNGVRLLGLNSPKLTIVADEYSLPPKKDDSPNIFSNPIAGIPITLYWETIAKINGEQNIFIRLIDEDGHSWGQVDRLILAGLWRPDRWKPGYFLRDEYRLPIDPATPPGKYHFEVGMYDFVTGQSYGIAKNIGEISLLVPKKPAKPTDFDTTSGLISAPINDNLTLLAHSFQDIKIPPGTELGGKIFWQVNNSSPEIDYQVEFSFLVPREQKRFVIAKTSLSASYPTSNWQPAEVVGTAYRLHVPAFALAGKYPFSVTVTDPKTGQTVGQAVTLGILTIEERDRNFELPSNVTPLSAFIGDEIELVGYKLKDIAIAPKETFGLTLYWRSVRVAGANYTVFVHAVGPDQVMRGQWDSSPVQGNSPTSGWIPGEIIEDHYNVPISKDAPPWKYDIFVGMYDPLTGQRLPLTSQNAPVSDGRVWLSRVQVIEP